MSQLRDDVGSRRRRAPWWWPLALLGVTAAVILSLGGAEGGFTAKIANAGDRVETGSLVTAAASGASTECDLSTATYSPITQSSNTATCGGTLAPSGTLASGTTTSATVTTISEKGSLASSAGITEGICGAVQLANGAAAADPMLVRGTTLSYAQAGPTSLSGSAGLGLSGASGYAADVAGGAGPTATSFTELVWFKTTTGGTLMGFANTPSAYSPGSWDKMLWVDNTGHVVFGVYTTTTNEITSTGTFADGNWHLAVASVSLTGGMSLSVDGGTAVTNVLVKGTQAYNGYWHVGWDNVASGWPDSPTNPYFTGTLANAAIIPSALTAAQTTALYTQTSQTSFAGQVITTDAASDFWPLGDNGTSVFTGTIPQVTPAACAFVDATIGVSGASVTCAAPSSPSACAAPTSTTTLATLAAKTTSFTAGPSPSQGLSVTVTLARDTTNTVAGSPYATGLHLTTALALAATAGSFSATLNWPAENIIL